MSIEGCDVRFNSVTESRDATRWRHPCRSQRWPPERTGEQCHRFVELGLPAGLMRVRLVTWPRPWIVITIRVYERGHRRIDVIESVEPGNQVS